MVAGKHLEAVAKDLGVKELEKVLLVAYQILEKASPLIAADLEATAVEKTVFGGASIVLPVLETGYKSLIDLNKDGQVG